MTVVDKVLQLLEENQCATVKYRKDNGAIARINFFDQYTAEHCSGMFSSLTVEEMHASAALLLVSNVESSIISVE